MVNEKNSNYFKGVTVYFPAVEDSAHYFLNANVPWPLCEKVYSAILFFCVGKRRKGRSSWWLLMVQQQIVPKAILACCKSRARDKSGSDL